MIRSGANSPGKRVTIRDVAKRSGVSSATVSHVLNGTRFVTEETRARVLEAIEVLHYRPSALARSLTTRVTHSIGVIVSDITNPFFTAVVRAIGDVALERGYYLTVCNSDGDSEQERTIVQALLSKQVDGLIMAPSDYDAAHFQEILHQGTPLVFIDRGLSPSIASTVCVDNQLGMRQAIEHLIADGHRDIAMILGRYSLRTTHERLQGYTDALQAHNIPLQQRLIRWSNSWLSGGFESTLDLLASDPWPSALLVGNNQMTMGSLRALQEAGVRVPHDLAVIGFDDHDWASLCSPPLTVVRQPTDEIGRLAVEAMFRLIDSRSGGQSAEPETIRLLPELVVRGSCSEPCLDAYWAARTPSLLGRP
jgi:LacI family transcriptional regulator